MAYPTWLIPQIDAVPKRDSYTCQICNIRGGKLEMDHIKEWCNYPELRLNPDNCRTLCHDCHTETDNYLSKAIGKSHAI